MSVLSEKELNEIREEAEKIFPGYIEGTIKDGYITAAVIYRQRSKVLVEALEQIVKGNLWKKHSPYGECVSIADKALDTYMNKNKEI
jgi:hypothetical protein